MLIIKQFTIGDRIPEDARMLGMNTFVDFKQHQRHVQFYFAVPEDRKKRKKGRSPQAQ